jgi:glutamate/tyrosine decarboxylase-like PLP-dependent enzyme
MEDGSGTPPTRSGRIDLDAATFRRLGHRLVDRIAELNATLSDRPVTAAPSPATVREGLGRLAAEAGEAGDPDTLLDQATDLLLEQSLFNGHPRFWGYISGAPAPIGVLGDLLAAAVNPNVGAWVLSPVATEIERAAVAWIAGFVGHPAGGGLLVSGGNVANHVGFLAALRRATGQEARSAGLRGLGSEPVLYASRETHTWVQKSTDLSGLGTDAIRWIDTDETGRMLVTPLVETVRADIAAGRLPFLVVANAGTVSTGAVDPLDEIADTCEKFGLWMHADGAYGALAASLPELSATFAGLNRADSVALDPHKWMYAPLEAGCTLVRDPEHLTDTFSYHPPYYNFETEELNFVDYGPQNSRGFRALKVWLSCLHVGTEGYRTLLREDIALARRAFERFDAEPDFEAHTCQLSITTYRYVPEHLRGGLGESETEDRLDALNDAILDRIEKSGEYFVSRAMIRGRLAQRLCIVNFRTTAADVDAFPAFVRRLGEEVSAQR